MIVSRTTFFVRWPVIGKYLCSSNIALLGTIVGICFSVWALGRGSMLCFRLTGLPLFDGLPSVPGLLNSVMKSDLHPANYFIIIVLQTAVTGLFLTVLGPYLKWRDPFGGSMGALLVLLFAFQVILLPVNHGMVVTTLPQSIERAEDLGAARPLKPGEEAWLLWPGRKTEGVTFLVRYWADEKPVRKLVTVKTDQIKRLAIIGDDKLRDIVQSTGLQTKVAAVLINRKLDVDATDFNGETALIKAARRGDLSMAQLLVSKGAKIHVSNVGKDTPLTEAARCGHIEVVELLLSHGADPLTCTRDGQTPLDLALQNGHFRILRPLVNAILAPSTVTRVRWARSCQSEKLAYFRERLGWNELVVAIVAGEKPRVRRLLAGGANPRDRGGSSRSPLYWAAALGDPEIVSMLIDYCAQVRSRDAVESLINGARRGDGELVRTLVNRDVPVDGTDKRGRTPLIAASTYGRKEIITLLLDRGANINHLSRNSETALVEAARAGHWEIVKLLIERGADLHGSQGGETLRHASRSGQVGLVKMLLHKGVNLISIDAHGRNALHWTVERTAQPEAVYVRIANKNGQHRVGSVCRPTISNVQCAFPSPQSSQNSGKLW